MIIFLCGADAYRRAERTGWWIEEYKKKHGRSPALRCDMADENALPALREFFASVSMFDPYKLAVLRNAFGSSDASALAKLLKEQTERSENIIVISEEKKPPAAFAFLTTKARCEALDAPTGPALRAFVEREAARRGIALEPAALRMIEQAARGDTWWIATELDRAALLGKTTLGAADFPELGLEAADVEGLLYELNSFSRGSRLAALQKLLRRRYDPGMVFNRLAYRASGSVSAAKNLPVFADYDVRVKSGKLDYEEALLALAIA